MLKQQQRGGAAAIKQGAVVRLRIQQWPRTELLNKLLQPCPLRQIKFLCRVQRRDQLRVMSKQRLVRVIQQP